jgi:hypothetical protein
MTLAVMKPCDRYQLHSVTVDPPRRIDQERFAETLRRLIMLANVANQRHWRRQVCKQNRCAVEPRK